MNLNKQLKIILNHFHIQNFNEVIEKGNKLLRSNPYNAFLHNIIGSSYLQLGKTKKAIDIFTTSLKLFPNNLSIINNIANSYKKELNYKKAEEFYLLLLNKKPDYINGLVNYANLKMSMNHVDQCLEIYKKILVNDPKNHLIYFNKATALHAMGNFDEAKIFAKKALEIKPDFTFADKLISTIIKYDENDAHFLKLKNDITNTNIPLENIIHLHFALAKAHFDNRQFEDFINHIEIANKKKRESISYDFEKDMKLFKSIKLLFNDVNFEEIELKENKKKIIFVLGMPRSGTSLVEQIISAHSNVFGAGELPFLQGSVYDKLESLEDEKQNINGIFGDINLMAENYLEQISILCPNDKIVLDKSPLNFLLIGFIRIFFPKSKIIHVKRSSNDTCFSCYKNSFNTGMNFTYNKKELALFYNSYADLMKFWEKKLPNFFYTVSYEDLVNEPNTNIKSILNFCDLNFEKNCVEFQDNKSPVRTISASQVREKIYKKSIHSFKMFKEPLSDIFDNLVE
jgi:tetratricopeptide (TPR) repeat protein